MPTPRLGCCAVERGKDRFLLPQEEPDDYAQTSPLSAPELGWRSWLNEWEGRQTASMRQHEEETKQLVESLGKDLVEKMRQMLEKRIRPAKSVALKPGVSEVDVDHPGPCEEFVTTERSPLNEGDKDSGLPWAPARSVQHLNDAFSDIIGGTRFHKSNTRHTTVTKSSGAQSPTEPDAKTYETLVSDETAEYVPKNQVQLFLFNLVHNNVFACVSALMIGIYAIAVGVLADLEMNAAIKMSEPPGWRDIVDAIFTGSFVLEFLLRLAAEGIHYFKGPDRNWNLFDMVIAIVGVLDLLMVDALNLAFLRILRTFRAMRLLRIIRIFKVFKELRLMMASILCCLVPLTWAFALLVAVIYVFAVVLLQGASDYIRDAGSCEHPFCEVLIGSFGGMAPAIYSLTQAISGGRSWGEFSDPFLEISPWYGVAFALFVIFVIFGVLNILTGVFVEGTTTLANVDKELVIQEQMSQNESSVGQIRKLFKEIDENQSGTITRSELLRNLRDERVRAYFSVLQMDVSEAHGLFQLLDRDESGEVSIDEFIMTCMRLKGTARSIDLAAMLFENKRLYTAIKSFMTSVDSVMRDIQGKLQLLKNYQEASLF